MKLYTIPYLADVYGQGAYGSCDYNQTSCSTSGGSSQNGSSNGGGSLVDTGTVVVLIVAIACALVVAGLLVRFWRRPAKKPEHNLGDGSDSK